jgi:hypothetical protein
MWQQRSNVRQAWLGDRGVGYAKHLLAVVGAVAFLARLPAQFPSRIRHFRLWAWEARQVH